MTTNSTKPKDVIQAKTVIESWETEGGTRAGTFTLMQLPYAEDALEPAISALTVAVHHGKHHAGYVAALNKLIEGTAYADLPLQDIIVKSAEDAQALPIFRNAAQVWNHNFYWMSMDPKGGGYPGGDLKVRLDATFETPKAFREAFTKAALGAFGSGWVWLIVNQHDKLEIVATKNADTPITGHGQPLITLDVWEHAYYLDYQNRRADYIETWFDRLVNWHFAEVNLGATTKRSA